MPKNNHLQGKSFCFTGPLKAMTREHAREMLENNGGVFKTCVSYGLDFLVTNNTSSGSHKNQVAREYGTKIINEKQFFDMVRGTTADAGEKSIEAKLDALVKAGLL